MTLKQAVEERKIRKGTAEEITRTGAYWAVDLPIWSYGGDGIGQSGATVSDYIQVRHYRDGRMAAGIVRTIWHQNSGTDIEDVPADALLDCETVEDVIRVASGYEFPGWGGPGENVWVSDYYRERLPEALPELPAALPSPDEDRNTVIPEPGGQWAGAVTACNRARSESIVSSQTARRRGLTD